MIKLNWFSIFYVTSKKRAFSGVKLRNFLFGNVDTANELNGQKDYTPVIENIPVLTFQLQLLKYIGYNAIQNGTTGYKNSRICNKLQN